MPTQQELGIRAFHLRGPFQTGRFDVLIDQRLGQAARGGFRQPWELPALPFRHDAIERHVVVPGLVGLVRLAS